MRRLAWGAVAAQVIFVGGWLVLGAVEGHGYSPMRHDISDLAALTAHHAGAARATLLVSGALTAAFALGVVRPIFGTAAGALLALSLPSLDNLTDPLFRLNCRAADAGCTMSRATSSWHGTMHLVMFGIAAIPTLVVPFVLARRMRATSGWRDWAARTKTFGFVSIALFVAGAATQNTGVQGLLQRILATFVTAGVAVLALRVAREKPAVQRAAAMTVSA